MVEDGLRPLLVVLPDARRTATASSMTSVMWGLVMLTSSFWPRMGGRRSSGHTLTRPRRSSCTSFLLGFLIFIIICCPRIRRARYLVEVRAPSAQSLYAEALEIRINATDAAAVDSSRYLPGQSSRSRSAS